MGRDWLIVDAPNAVWRAFYGVAHREPLPAVLMALHAVNELADEFGVADVAWAFDRKPYKRKELFDGYKAGRERVKVDEAEQAAIDDCRARIGKLASDYLPRLGYTNVLEKRGYEADDLMAAAVRGLAPGDRAVLVSADYDLYQLLGPTCAVYHPQTDAWVTAKTFRTKYGLDPSLWAEAKAIAGCSSDDVPGLRGVGIQTAVKFLLKQLPRTHKTCYDIHRFLKTPEYERNLALTALPYPGLSPIELAPDPDRRPQSWRRLCEELDLGRLADAMRAHDTIGALIRG